MKIQDDLDYYGELHITLESGEQYHVHKHDTKVEYDPQRNQTCVVIDSKKGDWKFEAERIESVEYPHSHKE